MSALGHAARQIGHRLVPRNRAGDYAFALAAFWSRHGRLPKRRHGGLNDALFHMRTTREIEDPLRVFVSDKELVKLYVTAKVGPQHNVPTLAILRTPEAAVSHSYPPDCVIKPTHLSAQVIFRTNGSEPDREKIRRWFHMNQYDVARGRNYKTLVPKVIVEPILFGRTDVDDVKIHCWHGVPKMIQVDQGRHIDHHRTWYTADWVHVPHAMKEPIGKVTEPPANLELMLSLARALSADFDLMRVDLYTDGVSAYVGELTNAHGNGGDQFETREGDLAFARILFGPDGWNAP
jgi:hypothetical protein